MFEMVGKEIAHTNIFNFAFLLQFNKRLPCLKSNIFIFLILWLQLAHSWPMDQNKIQILAVKLFNDCLDCFPWLFASLLLRADFTGDIKLISANSQLFNSLSYLLLVSINTGSIDMSVAIGERNFSALHAIFTSQLVCPIADHWYFSSCMQRNCRIFGNFLVLHGYVWIFYISDNLIKINISIYII